MKKQSCTGLEEGKVHISSRLWWSKLGQLGGGALEHPKPRERTKKVVHAKGGMEWGQSGAGYGVPLKG